MLSFQCVFKITCENDYFMTKCISETLHPVIYGTDYVYIITPISISDLSEVNKLIDARISLVYSCTQ